MLDKVCQKAFKTKNENSWPFLWTVRTHDQSLKLAPRRQNDQNSKQHENKTDDSTNADNYYANDDHDDDDDDDDDDANGERPPVASIQLISSDMQNILGTNCLRWAEARKESSSDSVEWLTRSSQSASSKWPTYPVDIMGGCHTVFVYCDLIQDEVVGDKRTSLLRSVTNAV